MLRLTAVYLAHRSLAGPAPCLDPSTCSAKTFPVAARTLQLAIGEAEQSSQPRESLEMLQVGVAVQERESFVAQLEDVAVQERESFVARSEDVAVQERESFEAQLDVGLPSPELQSILPIDWLHIPKCGSSFANTLLSLPGVCPRDQTASLTAVMRKTLRTNIFTSEWGFFEAFNKEFQVGKCTGFSPKLSFLEVGLGEPGEPSRLEASRGHLVTFLRQPEQRLMSAYRDMMAANVQEHGHLSDTHRAWGGWPNNTLPTLRQFAAVAVGCEVRMLTRGGMPCSGQEGPPSAEEVKAAKGRLRNDFAFVGISNQWRLSICLFTTMFKLPCNPVQFEAFRMRRADPTTLYDPAFLGGMEDPYDAEVYATASEVFAENLAKYNVTDARCWEECWGPAGLSDEEPEGPVSGHFRIPQPVRASIHRNNIIKKTAPRYRPGETYVH